jgi:MarR family transcriptional regulator, lower aerobic nicotinate degradation pathway regulator
MRTWRFDRKRGEDGAGTQMTRSVSPRRNLKPSRPAYVLEDQVGFILRQVWQRHAAIFAREIGANLTPTQWAALAKLNESGPSPQNLLGRLTAMDAATIKGVIDRLTKRGFTRTKPDPDDKRRLLVTVTERGAALYERARPIAADITKATLAPLSAREREQLMALLTKLV